MHRTLEYESGSNQRMAFVSMCMRSCKKIEITKGTKKKHNVMSNRSSSSSGKTDVAAAAAAATNKPFQYVFAHVFHTEMPSHAINTEQNKWAFAHEIQTNTRKDVTVEHMHSSSIGACTTTTTTMTTGTVLVVVTTEKRNRNVFKTNFTRENCNIGQYLMQYISIFMLLWWIFRSACCCFFFGYFFFHFSLSVFWQRGCQAFV